MYVVRPKLGVTSTNQSHHIKFLSKGWLQSAMLVPEIVLRLLEEQANTISKVKLNKIGFYGFG